MYPGLSEEQKERIAAHLNQGLYPGSTARIEHVSAQTIRQIQSHRRTVHTVNIRLLEHPNLDDLLD